MLFALVFVGGCYAPDLETSALCDAMCPAARTWVQHGDCHCLCFTSSSTSVEIALSPESDVPTANAIWASYASSCMK
jgi:hypothetical protein